MKTARICLILGILIVSCSPVLVKIGNANGLAYAFYRIFIAFVCLFFYALFQRKLLIRRREIFLTLLGGILFGLDIGLWNLSLRMTAAGISTLIANLAPIWVGLFSIIFLQLRPSFNFWIAVLISLVGLAITLGVSQLIHISMNQGILLALLSSLLYAFYILVTKKILKKMAVVTFMVYNMGAASIMLAIIMVAFNISFFGFSTPTWLSMAALGIFCQLLGWLVLNYSISKLEPTEVSLSFLSQTVITASLAWIFLGEKLTSHQILGSFVVLTGISFLFFKKKITPVEAY